MSPVAPPRLFSPIELPSPFCPLLPTISLCRQFFPAVFASDPVNAYFLPFSLNVSHLPFYGTSLEVFCLTSLFYYFSRQILNEGKDFVDKDIERKSCIECHYCNL